MHVERLAIPDVELLTGRRFGDDRGYFRETFKRDPDSPFGALATDYVQDNESMSATVGTIRGIHYQIDPHPQAKLVRVIQGAIYDAAVDLRVGSPTFGQHVGVELRGDEDLQLFVPVGFGHIFCTLEPDTIVAYKTSDYYAANTERAIRWDDPDIGIAWPIDTTQVTLSDKDAVAPLLRDQPDLFPEPTS